MAVSCDGAQTMAPQATPKVQQLRVIPTMLAAAWAGPGEADDCAGPQPAVTIPEVKPLLEHTAPVTGEAPVNVRPLVDEAWLGAFSLMCTLQMDGTNDWARVFDFSRNPDLNSITAGAIGRSSDLHFTVFSGTSPVSVNVANFFELGKEATMLCTVSASGHMKVFKDGVLVGENPYGAAPAPIDRPRMILGSHFHFTGQSFHGTLANVKVWDQEVSWPEAAKAAQDPQEQPKPEPPAARSSDKDSVADSETGSGADSVLLLDPSATADSDRDDGSDA